MKKKYIFILVVCLLLTGCGSKSNTNKLSELSVFKNNMLKDIKNYSYEASYSTKIDNTDTTIKLDCKTDLNTKVEYCYVQSLYYDSEKYSDYNTRLILHRRIHPDTPDMDWIPINRYYNSNPNKWFTIIDIIVDPIKEEKDEGTYYNGTVTNTLRMATILNEMDGNIIPEDLAKNVSDLPIEVFIDKEGYIREINTTFAPGEKINITFKDYNNTPKQEMPSNY